MHTGCSVKCKEIAGHQNYSLAENVKFAEWEKRVKDVYEIYGFMMFNSRQVERAQDLEKKGGDDREIWAISPYLTNSGFSKKEGDGKTTLCLPFDHTVPLAIFLANNTNTKLPLRRADCGYSWRVEKPEPGRFCAFRQFDVDIVDRNLNILAEMECILAIVKALEAIEIPSFHVYLNHINIAKNLISSMDFRDKKSEAKALKVIDKLEKVDKEASLEKMLERYPEVDKKVMEIFIEDFSKKGEIKKMAFSSLEEKEQGEKWVADLQEIKKEVALDRLMVLKPKMEEESIKSLIEVFSFKGDAETFLAMVKENDSFDKEVVEYANHVKELIDHLTESGLDPRILQFCPGMVRGLAYYTGIVFETFLDDAPHRGSIASGGRYDNLVEAVSDKSKGVDLSDIQGFGGSIGLTRLFDVCLREDIIEVKAKTSSKVMVCYRKVEKELDALYRAKAVELAGRVRKLGIPTELYTNSSHGLRQQLKYAANKEIPVVAMVLGTDSKDGISIKKMYETDLDKKEVKVGTVEKAVAAVEEYFSK